MKPSPKLLEMVRSRLSEVRFRTVAEIRADLPDKRWKDLPPEVAEDWASTYKALNALVAQRDVEVRIRRSESDKQSTYECSGRQEYKLRVHGGRKFRLPLMFCTMRPADARAW